MAQSKDGVARRGLLTAGAIGGLLAAAPGAAPAKPGGSGGASKLSTPPEAVVETKAGKVRGCVRDGVFTFKGIPYAKDTGGAARFLPSQPMAPWTGVRTALTYGPCCPQVVRGGWRSDETAFIYDWDDGYPGEDCLRLNIWSGGLGGKPRPVMFWIHGGGYETGSSQELPAYDGERLARRGDVVFVSVNHRLGAFGFLDLSQLGGANYAMSGNAGQLDLVVALQWVRDNIAAFGGDPGNVTIFGQSGGGAKVSTLMAMPSAKGLFHKAIVESGSLLSVGDTGYTRRLAEAVLRELNIGAGDLDKLAAVPPMTLVAAADKAKNAMPKGPAGTINLGWAPVVDGHAIPAPTWAKGAPALSANVPMIIGTNLNEACRSVRRQSNGAGGDGRGAGAGDRRFPWARGRGGRRLGGVPGCGPQGQADRNRLAHHLGPLPGSGGAAGPDEGPAGRRAGLPLSLRLQPQDRAGRPGARVPLRRDGLCLRQCGPLPERHRRNDGGEGVVGEDGRRLARLRPHRRPQPSRPSPLAGGQRGGDAQHAFRRRLRGARKPGQGGAGGADRL